MSLLVFLLSQRGGQDSDCRATQADSPEVRCFRGSIAVPPTKPLHDALLNALRPTTGKEQQARSAEPSSATPEQQNEASSHLKALPYLVLPPLASSVSFRCIAVNACSPHRCCCFNKNGSAPIQQSRHPKTDLASERGTIARIRRLFRRCWAFGRRTMLRKMRELRWRRSVLRFVCERGIGRGVSDVRTCAAGDAAEEWSHFDNL